MPQSFPASSSNTIYKVKWNKNNVIITVKGDENINVSSPNTLSVAKGSKWADIKTQVMTIASPKEYFEIKEWRVNDKDGELIGEAKEFKENTTVFAVSNREKIRITVNGDEGIEVISDNFVVDKGLTWADIKTQAQSKIKTKEYFDFGEWHIGSASGDIIEEDKIFKENSLIFATSNKQQIKITVKGDEGFEVSSSNTINADKGSKWESIKVRAQEKANIKEDFDFVAWHLTDKDGELLLNEKEFKENTVVFAVSKRKVVEYKVEHLRENIENAEYTVYETETKTGEAGKNTSAQTKQYEGFSCQGLVQAVIKADGSTVIQIKYKRNITSLILDLDGGKTTATILKDGEAGKKLLEGKFEAKVEVVGLEKEGYGFEKWEPELPQSFPKDNNPQIYVAKWKKDNVIITLKGDTGVLVSSSNKVKVPKGAKWLDIRAEIIPLVNAKEYFDFAEWHIGSANGELIKDETKFEKSKIVFATSKRQQINLTVKGGEGINVKGNEPIAVGKGLLWSEIKGEARDKIEIDENFELKEWHLNNADGELIEEGRVFIESATVFAVSIRKRAQYKVEYWKENIENENYVKAEEEFET